MICYYLKGKNGEYIARDPTGRIKLVSDLGDALLVPEIEKKNVVDLINYQNTDLLACL